MRGLRVKGGAEQIYCSEDLTIDSGTNLHVAAKVWRRTGARAMQEPVRDRPPDGYL